MLNLVQLQERLRDVPMQALMQYANGANPQIPPFLALGELNRRKKMQESAAAEQAQEMEGAPTVKQQIEQASGLMALQGSRQRQAAQQQAGIQANAPMAAPNTTPSEPAQLAGGGFIDDIVVPRDFQRGGMAMNPEMMKKLMMLQAMKKRQGIAGLPANNLRRADFAGGGIVAFQGGGMPDTSDTMRKKAEQYREMLRTLFGKPKTETVDPADTRDLLKESALEASDNYPDESRRGSGSFATKRDEKGELVYPDFTKPYFPGDRPSTQKAPPAEEKKEGLAAIAGPSRGAAPRSLGIAAPADMTDAQRLQGLRDLQRLAGVKENPFAEIEDRYKKIEEEDVRRRADQPMDQLTRFLQGVATGPRGGNFGTQGAAGVAASSKLREEQAASNRRQDLDMAALRMSLAKEADARARGDVDAVRSEKEKQEKLKLDIAKLESEDAYRKGALEVQRGQLDVYRERNLLDKSAADRTRQMGEINDFISNFRSRNSGNPKYFNKPELLERDAIAAALQFFGPERFRGLGLAPSMSSSANKGEVDKKNPLLQ